MLPKFIDLFAGAGGMSLGFEMAGTRAAYAIEVDKWAALTYRKNNPYVILEERDIESVSDSEIADLRDLGVEIVIGGPPCQGFSHSNIVNKDPKDPRNSLFKFFLKYVAIVKPGIAILENVPGLLRTRTDTGDSVIDIIDSKFRSIGYICRWRILEASRFGVPQRRDRLFIVATPESRPIQFAWPGELNAPSIEVAQQCLFKCDSAQPIVTLWDAISDLPQCTAENYRPDQTYISPPQNEFQSLMRRCPCSEIHNHEPMRHTQRIVSRFAQIGFGESEASVADSMKPRKRSAPDTLSNRAYDQNSRRQRPDAPCSTVVASSHTNFIHPYLNRNFTVREIMRIQSFPDDYIAFGKRAVLSKKLSIRKGLLDEVYLDQRMQIGNAVPPLLANAIAIAAIRALQNEAATNAA